MFRFFSVILLGVWVLPVQSATLEDISFAALSGDALEIKLTFDGTPPDPKSYSIETPARIALDLPGVASSLSSKYHTIGSGNARSVTVVSANDRTRVVVNLTSIVPYITEVNGNELVLTLGLDEIKMAQKKSQQASSANVAVVIPAVPVEAKEVVSAEKEPAKVVDIDFRRGEAGDGDVIIMFNRSDVSADVVNEGGRIRVSLDKVHLPASMQRRLDVIDFATPVQTIDSFIESGQGTILIDPKGEYDYLAYQANKKLVINIKPMSEGELDRNTKEKFPYVGEKLSLNFQDIETRAVLQLIADFTSLNLVASDTVTGRITLRLQNVPWDQALEIVLKTKGLSKRQIGNVLMIAPADEIAAREKMELEANKQVESLAPLRTEFVQIRYAKAVDIVSLLGADQGMLSERGSASVDERTNTILIQETANNIEKIRKALAVLDVPVRQVMIEARIVVARDNVGEDIGIRWGGYNFNHNSDGTQRRVGSGSLDTNNDVNNSLNQIAAGDDPDDIRYLPESLMVDMPVTKSGASSFALGFSAFNYDLGLELSALESKGSAEIVSQPKVITGDGQAARIESGTEVPYQQASSSGATSVAFKSAVLALEVTPQITPDDRIIMDLKVNQDSVGEVFNGVPSIDTRNIETQVLVENGETIVLGGIFQNEEIETITKTPFLGDLPYVGRLFKAESRETKKTELLIFITPRLLKDSLVTR